MATEIVILDGTLGKYSDSQPLGIYDIINVGRGRVLDRRKAARMPYTQRLSLLAKQHEAVNGWWAGYLADIVRDLSLLVYDPWFQERTAAGYYYSVINLHRRSTT